MSFISTAVTTMLTLTQLMTRGDELESLAMFDLFYPSKSKLLQPFMVLNSATQCEWQLSNSMHQKAEHCPSTAPT